MIKDFKTIHSYWMNLVYERHLNPHPVLGKETPETTKGKILQNSWWTIGILFSAVIYPVLLLGFGIRFVFVDKINNFVRNHGILSTILLISVLWGSLIGTSYYLGETETATAVAASSVIAVVSTILSYYIRKIGGRFTTVLLSYPLAYTAILLPPVTFAVIHSGYGGGILNLSTEIAVWMQNTIAKPLGLREAISNRFDLTGLNYVVLWTIFSFILGWLTGVIVSISRLFK